MELPLRIEERAEPDGEALARRLFALWHEKSVTGLARLLHPEARLSLLPERGQRLSGREAALDFFREVFSWTAYEPTASAFVPLGPDVVIARGRLRWVNGDETRDVPRAWMIQGREGLAWRVASLGSVEAARELARDDDPG